MQKMSFPQLGGYSLASVGGPPSALPAAAAPPPSSQLLMACTSSSTSPSSSVATSARSVIGEPASGQTLLDYPAGLLAAAYPRMAAAGLTGAEASVYGSASAASAYAAAAAAQSYLPTLSTDPSVLYGSLANSPYDLKDSAEAWRNLQAQTAAYYSYDPTMMAYPYNGYGFDFNAARRKNATKENTGTLKAWLNEHRKNPYPTKGEKIMLAIITKMTLTQVSTWFANARRRLKKENKMTWTPKNGSRDSDDDDDDDDDKRDCDDGDLDSRNTSGQTDNNSNSLNKSSEGRDGDVEVDVESIREHRNKSGEDLLSDGEEEIDAGSASDLDPSNDRHNTSHPHSTALERLTSPPSSSGSPPPCTPIPFRPPGMAPAPPASRSIASLTSNSTTTNSSSDGTVKPRIWSLADVVASSNPHSRLSPPGNTAPHSAFGTPAGLRPQGHHHHGVGPIPGSPLRPWVHQGSSPYSLPGTSATQTLAGFAPHPYGLAAVRAAASAAGHLPPGATSSPHNASPGSPVIPSFQRIPVSMPSPILAHHRDGARVLNGLPSRPVPDRLETNSSSSPGNSHDSRTAFTPVVKRNLNEPLKV